MRTCTPISGSTCSHRHTNPFKWVLFCYPQQNRVEARHVTQKVEMLDAMGVFFTRQRSRDLILLEVRSKKKMAPVCLGTLKRGLNAGSCATDTLSA